MQLRHLKTISPQLEMVEGKFQKISALAWSPNNMRLAVASADRFITLFDENGEVKDKFSTKPADKAPGAPRNYIVRAVEFSPDSTRLAVAQSDNILFVYKLGLNWGDKKTICNKFAQPAPVTAMCWPSQHGNHVVYALADGKVRLADLENNKTTTLYSTESYVVALAAGPDGHSFVSSHLDGTIFRYTLPTDEEPASQAQVAQVGFVPYALAWGEMIAVGGNSPQVLFLDASGTLVQKFDYSSDEKVKEFTCASVSPFGQTVVFGNFNRFYVYVYNPNKDAWEEGTPLNVENLYSVTALRWKADGSRLVTGALCGAVDLYEACMRRYIYGGKYEFTYTSPSSVIVKRLSTGVKLSIKSRFGCDIKKINIYSDRFLVANTAETLILGDLKENLHSEIAWNGSGKEKYFFDNPSVCMVFNAGELSVIEYGKSDVLGSCRTEHMSHHLISVRINEAKARSTQPIKKIAYLLDLQSIRILDLVTGGAEATVNHDAKIDWLELNPRGTKLLFRDKRRALHLFDIPTQTRSTLLNYCNYVQWVPDSDVVVAQSRRELCVWYSIDNPADFTIIKIKGDVEQIERGPGRTEVVVDEGMNTVNYPLDDGLISFGFAVDSGDLRQAVAILERLPPHSPGSEGLWLQLSKLALEHNEYVVAERCYAALGDVGKTQLLHKINKLILDAGNTPAAREHYTVKAMVAMLNKQFKRAEAIFLQNGQVEQAIAMYRQLHKWDEALAVAESRNHPQAPKLRAEYFHYLISTKQEEVAGALKEREGDFSTALQLYIKGGHPQQAADLVLKRGITQDTALCEQVAEALLRGKLFEKAGEFLENLGLHKRALDAFVRGHCYFKAAELVRMHFPGQLVRLMEEWGDYMAAQRQFDAACSHYIQAGAYHKAINAAIEAKQWIKAVQILHNVDAGTAKPFYKRIAHHFAEIKNYDDAERYFIQGGAPQEAVSMYTNAGLWDKAHKIAVTYMPEQEVSALYVNRARLMEAQGKFKEAEHLYLTVNEPDLAINMYKKTRQYEQMIRLVSSHRKDLLNETHLHLAHQFESEGNLKLAEQHFIKAGEWKPAVSMYRESDMWEDCLRVAKTHGGPTAYIQVAYAWAKVLGGEAGVKMLAKRNLAEAAVDYAMERGEFPDAFHIAERCCKQKLPDVHLQYAMALEDEGAFERAEEEFIKARKPKEAIDMYVHQREWDHALRVAEQYEPSALPDIYEGQGKYQQEQKNYTAAESLFIQGKKPELAIKMYKEMGQWDSALKIAKTHAAHLVPQLQSERSQFMSQSAGLAAAAASREAMSGGGSGMAESAEQLIAQAKQLVQNKQYTRAIETYLKATRDLTSDHDALERAWESAVTLAMEFTPGARASEVVVIVGQRLAELERWDSAAEMFITIDDWKQAIDVFVQGRMFEKARQLAQSSAPQFISYVDQRHQEHLVRNEQLGDLGDVNPELALEMFVKRNDWARVYEVASRLGLPVLQKHATMHAQQLMKESRIEEAVSVLAKYGALPSQGSFGLLEKLANAVFSLPDAKDAADGRGPAHELREVLYKVVAAIRSKEGPQAPRLADFERLLLVAHYVSLRKTCLRQGLKTMGAKLSVSLLRYTTDVPVDKAFYDAGAACDEQKWTNMAFVFWNRFIDICGVIDEPDSGDIENTDFADTDIPTPFQTPLPTTHNIPADTREHARDWVLNTALKPDVNQSLSTRPCDKCGASTYVAGLSCHSCQQHYEPCVVSGYPVSKKRGFKCKSCDKTANLDDWNAYISKFKSCPWCGVPH